VTFPRVANAPVIRSAARSAIAITGAWMPPQGMTGITEASAM
jgi:hypothetical protein